MRSAVNELKAKQTKESKGAGEDVTEAFEDVRDDKGERLTGQQTNDRLKQAMIPKVTSGLQEAQRQLKEYERELEKAKSERDSATDFHSRWLAEGAVERAEIKVRDQRQVAIDEKAKHDKIAEKEVGRLRHEAQHGDPEQQAAARKKLAELAKESGMTGLSEDISGTGATGQIKAAQERAQKSIGTARELQEQYIKKALEADKKGLHDEAEEHWKKAREYGASVSEYEKELDAANASYRDKLTRKNKDRLDIETNRIKEEAKQGKERALMAQMEYDAAENEKKALEEMKESEKKQKKLIDEIAESEDVQSRKIEAEKEAIAKGLTGYEKWNYVQQEIYEEINRRIKIANKVLEPEERVISGGRQVREASERMAGAAPKDARDKATKDKEEEKRQRDKANQDRQRQKEELEGRSFRGNGAI